MKIDPKTPWHAQYVDAPRIDNDGWTGYGDEKRRWAQCGRYKVAVYRLEREMRYGSWERGFKWTRTQYGILVRFKAKLKGMKYPGKVFSADNGRTWNESLKVALKTKGKVIINKHKSKEMAFEGIQRINRSYDPNYRWRP
jgi:hypothetical protein